MRELCVCARDTFAYGQPLTARHPASFPYYRHSAFWHSSDEQARAGFPLKRHFMAYSCTTSVFGTDQFSVTYLHNTADVNS